jgi:ferrous iron transport protein B
MEPLGLNWRSSIALITSIPAKELVVSTLGVLYNNGDENLSQSLVTSGDFTKSSAAAFLVFILLFFPCIATIGTIVEETGNKKFAIFAIVYNTAIAWIIAFIINQAGNYLG